MSRPRGGDGRVRQELAHKLGTAMRAQRQTIPLERTGAFTLACMAILLVVVPADARITSSSCQRL
jgi:hypothetical protein